MGPLSTKLIIGEISDLDIGMIELKKLSNIGVEPGSIPSLKIMLDP